MLLDRYIFRQWTRLFLLTTLGFPVVAILIDLTDNLKTLLDRGIGPANIMLGYLYQFPEKMFEIIPAAVLFATVFTVGALGRHSELTAAKAGGISFHRLMLPIYLGALLATALCLGVEEVAPVTTEQKLQIHGDKSGKRSQRFNFVFRADRGWVYMIRTLDASTQRLRDVVLTRQGTGAGYPSLNVSADSASWDSTSGAWKLYGGASRVVVNGSTQASFGFKSMRLRELTQTPADLLAEPRRPEEMRYAVTELGLISFEISALQPAPGLGDRRYDPIWAEAERLNVPVCIHGSRSPSTDIGAERLSTFGEVHAYGFTAAS